MKDAGWTMLNATNFVDRIGEQLCVLIGPPRFFKDIIPRSVKEPSMQRRIHDKLGSTTTIENLIGHTALWTQPITRILRGSKNIHEQVRSPNAYFAEGGFTGPNVHKWGYRVQKKCIFCEADDTQFFLVWECTKFATESNDIVPAKNLKTAKTGDPIFSKCWLPVIKIKS